MADHTARDRGYIHRSGEISCSTFLIAFMVIIFLMLFSGMALNNFEIILIPENPVMLTIYRLNSIFMPVFIIIALIVFYLYLDKPSQRVLMIIPVLSIIVIDILELVILNSLPGGITITSDIFTGMFLNPLSNLPWLFIPLIVMILEYHIRKRDYTQEVLG